ncbi:protein-L-isoaspartate O-methyltransferase [Candidatus Micrarchaeota archaeon]|nr:MAG: protein-L-isoaspartate O-methyltransferase [Candidatus Micrarchaeota archaeon]
MESFEEKRVELVKSLIDRGYLKSKALIDAFLHVRREDFVEEKNKAHAYADMPIPIGKRQTVSQPLTIAFMLESLAIKDGDKVLEIGTGTGYQAALIAEINRRGKIYTIERIRELYEKARQLLSKYKNVKVIYKDGSEGLPDYAPYDKIVVSCAWPKTTKPLLEQLKEGGRLVLPLGSAYFSQRLVMYEKRKGSIIEKDLNFPCVFVPLRKGCE